MRHLISYLWPFGAYSDADQGGLLERAAASRRNHELSRSLPVYINRWAVLASVQLILTEMAPRPLAPVFALLFTISACALLHLVRVWIMFRRPF